MVYVGFISMTKRKLIITFLFFAAALNVYSEPLENLISPAQAQRLRASNELIIDSQLKTNPVPELLPMNNELRRIVTTARNTLNPNMLVESLYLYKKPVQYDTTNGSWFSQRTGIFNQVAAISTLTGVQYHSSSRGESRVFYEYSSVVDGPNGRNPLPDPVYTRLPSTMTLHAKQRDLTFGENIYRYDYRVTSDAIIFTQENVTSLSIGIIPVIGKGKLRSVMAIIDCGDSILIYSVSMVNALSVPGLKDRMTSSFSSRAEAVLRWFTGRLDSEVFS